MRSLDISLAWYFIKSREPRKALIGYSTLHSRNWNKAENMNDQFCFNDQWLVFTFGNSFLIPVASLNSSSSASNMAKSNRLNPPLGRRILTALLTFSTVKLFSCKVLKYNWTSALRLNTISPTWVPLEEISKEATIEDTKLSSLVQFVATLASDASIKIPRSIGVSWSG